MVHSLRKYQTNGVSAIVSSWNNKKRPMVTVATGGGKTVMIAQLLVQTVPQSHRAIVIAHTEEIVYQIQSTVAFHYGTDVGIVMGKHHDYNANIIIASRQSLGPNRLSKILNFGPIHVLIIDEAHHATSDNTYGSIVRNILSKNPSVNVAGFTATPTRADQLGTDQKGDLFDEIVFSWSISDGIRGGYLVPAKHVDVDRHLYKGLNFMNLLLHLYESHIYSSNRQCLAFFPSVNMSIQFSRFLTRNGYPCYHIDGTTPKDKRNAILSSYKNGEIRIVSNMEVLTEGFDAPNTSAILLVRPTRSKTLLTQILGRGLRKAPNKRDCLIIHVREQGNRFPLQEILKG